MAHDVVVPPVAEDVTEAVLSKWLISVGDTVRVGQVLCEVETAKAAVEVESPADGVVTRLNVAEGEEFPMAGTVIAVIGEDAGTSRNTSPSVRRLAARLGVDLSDVLPTGLHGRILREDVERAAAAAAPAAAAPAASASTGRAGTGRRVELSGGVETARGHRLLRRVIADRMSRAKREIPHFYLERETDVGDLLASLRKQGLGVNEAVLKAVAVSLARHRALNGTYVDDAFVPGRGVHLGVAVGTDEGLYVPVIRDADQRSLADIAATVEELSRRAGEHRLDPDELEAGTFTVSNLGMYGVSRFSAIINPPQVGILAVGAVRSRLAQAEGELRSVPVVSLTLSCDHRAVDGVAAARFLAEVAELLQRPPADWFG